jgi:hypothetical protein
MKKKFGKILGVDILVIIIKIQTSSTNQKRKNLQKIQESSSSEKERKARPWESTSKIQTFSSENSRTIITSSSVCPRSFILFPRSEKKKNEHKDQNQFAQDQKRS